ncbi:probable insulin-like peptide 4 isoform X2 [Drosophila elegans]|uniref:probable insulin-like peptide 4 isoform X2 n=1 Tax=Drosophila elegans TaxID=30023 RepID=UPI0007E76641|nr:probable insulin-like peptide 4 isoform X2 [Drosophila elegans]
MSLIRVRRSEGAKDKDRMRSLIRKLQQPEEETEMESESATESASASATELPASGSGRKLRRHRRRIAHECCKEGCTYDDIMEYCA